MEEFIIEKIEIDDKETLIDEVMKNYGQEILQLVYSYVHNKAIAEDLTQDIFVKCYKNLHTYKKKSKFKSWLWRIAINHCKDYLKSWYNKNVIVSEDYLSYEESKNKSLEDTVIQDDEDYMLTSAVMKLPVKFREVIYLFYFEEMQIKEIAVVTGNNSNTVKTRLKRAKKILKEQLGGK
ncbi:sigma-70 family RNA polymerase sigma factor [Virgibacillus necropolis]|uniref:sigma-70 family RNA polymerase sigma factor n=1 Tax=Virgibacillus necropolis TaxID=163877 RepID=UPI00384F68FE